MASPSLDELLAPFLQRPGDAGIFSDFDGTLAPIVDDPGASRPLPEAVDVLHALAARYGRVAVVSGRPGAFLATHLSLAAGRHPPGLLAMGLYGLERVEDGRVVADPRGAEWASVVDRASALARDEAPPGLGVEHKGLSLTIHYRTAPDLQDWARQWAGEQADATGLVVHRARMSEELRPPVEADKGTVVAELSEGLAAVCFLGDDVGDLPAFAALDRLAEGGAAALKVAVRSEESPSELLAGADTVVDGPEGALEVLRRLLDGEAS